MWVWIGLGVFAALVIVIMLYSALVLASREDDFMEEYYRNRKLEKLKKEERDAG